MNNVSDYKGTSNKVHKYHYESKKETCKSVVYRKYRHIRLALIVCFVAFENLKQWIKYLYECFES
jgi:hypothetical protein